MGFRDDATALEARREVLGREIKGLETELSELRQEGEALRQTIRRKRFRLAMARAARWMVRHPKTMVFLALVFGLVVLITVKVYQERRERRLKMEATLGKGCPTRLTIDASYSGARVFVNGTDVGKVPLDVAICRGYYRVQVIHHRTLPWQRIVSVGVQPSVELNAALIPYRAEERPNGVLVFSSPPGAIVFANGAEMGRTPVLIETRTSGTELRLALWSSATAAPLRLWNGEARRRGLWFHFPLAAEAPR